MCSSQDGHTWKKVFKTNLILLAVFKSGGSKSEVLVQSRPLVGHFSRHF